MKIALMIIQMLCGLFLTVYIIGVITTVSEWKNIRCPGWKKVLYTFTLPLFMLTFIPICIASFFGKVTWKPIRHTVAVGMQE